MLLLLVVAVTLLGVWLFFRCYAPFGGRTAAAIKRRSSHFRNGIFVNDIPTPMGMGFVQTLKVTREFFRNDPARRPSKPLVPDRFDLEGKPLRDGSLTWFGHSAFLLQLHGKTLLLDPMFGTSPSPFPRLTSKRFSSQLPVVPEELPYVDAVLISHDHYDHLDYPSIIKLRDKVGMFYVPIGLAAHLRRWGVRAQQIQELDWWEQQSLGDLTFICTPSRHFSGRTLTDRNATLWASWVVDAGGSKLYFSGDGGYGPHFKQIGDKYGPFDLTLMECGQYDDRWANIHMTPEQTVQAHQDLRGKRMVPMHWGAFVLALHPWAEPVERALAAAKKAGVAVLTPKIGQTIPVKTATRTSAWWK